MSHLRVFAIAMFMSLAGSSASSADLPTICELNGARRIADKLEAYVQSGVGFVTDCKNNDCCVPSKFRQILLIERRKNASVWTRAVYFDRLNIGIAGKNINATIVDSSGREIGIASGEYKLQNANVMTDVNGFSFLPVIVTFTEQAPTSKVYLLRFSYSDRDAISFSYGPYFYIRDSRPNADVLDMLRTKGFSPSQID